MKIPKKIVKKRREYTFIKRYRNFILYKETKTGFKECFKIDELGLIEKQSKIININPSKVKI